MDLSVLKYNKQQANAAAANAAPKAEAQSVNDAFLSILSKVRVSKTIEEGSENVFSRITEKANTSTAFKSDEKRVETSRPDRKETVKAPQKRNNPPEQKTVTNKTSFQEQNDAGNGQKIPVQENTSDAVTEKNEAKTPETGKKEDISKKTQNEETDLETAAVLNMGGKNIPVPVQAAAAIPAAGTVQGNAETAADTGAAENLPISDASAEVPASLLGQQVNKNTNAPVKTSPESETVQTNALPANTEEADLSNEQLIPAVNADSLEKGEEAQTKLGTRIEKIPEHVIEQAQKQFAPAENTDEVSDKVLLNTKTNETKTQEKQPASQNAPTSEQARQLAAELPQETHAAIKVQTTQQTDTVQETTKETEDVSIDEMQPVLKQNTQETAPKNEYKTANVDGKVFSKQNEDGQRNSDMNNQQQMPGQQTAGMAATGSTSAAAPVSEQSFSSALKGSVSGVDSVSQTTSSASAEGKHALFNAPGNEGLKGKAVAGTVSARTSVPTNELVDQIKVNITKAAKEGLEKININLKPKELGNIQVSLEVDKDGNMKASIIASRPETLDMLQKDVSILKQALADAGLKTNDNAFSFSYRGDQQSQQEAGQFAGNDNRHSNNNLPAGVENGSENTDDLTEAVIASSWTSGRHALNIRV